MGDQIAPLVPLTSAARHNDEPTEEKCLYVTTTTWSRDSHELFDYEARHVHKKTYFLKRSGRIFRTAIEILVVPDGRPLPNQGGDFLLSIRQREGSYTVVPADKNIQATNSSAAIMPKKLWLIVKELPSGTHQLQENDVIKLGRFKLRVKQLVKSGTTLPELRLDDLETPQSIVTPDEAATMQCRICLLDGGTTEDPLVCPCQCKGSIKFVHLDCLRHWINGRLSLLSDESQQKMSFFFKQLHCELCKTPFPSSVILNGEKVQIVYVPTMEPPFIILEHIVGTANKGLHVISMGSRKELKLGRGHESDVRIADVSISRYHATIRFANNEFVLEDHNSKFGTLVSLRKLHTIEPTHCLAVQVGRTVLNLSLRRAPLDFEDVVGVPENVSGPESEGDDRAGASPPGPPRASGNNYPGDRSSNGREGGRPIAFQESYPGNQPYLDSEDVNPAADEGESSEFGYSQERGSFGQTPAVQGEGDFLVHAPEGLGHFHSPLGLYPHAEPLVGSPASLQYALPVVHTVQGQFLQPTFAMVDSDYLVSSPAPVSDAINEGHPRYLPSRTSMPYSLLLPFGRGQPLQADMRGFVAPQTDGSDIFARSHRMLSSIAPPPTGTPNGGPPGQFAYGEENARGTNYPDPTCWGTMNPRFFQRDPNVGRSQVLTSDSSGPIESLTDRPRTSSPRHPVGRSRPSAARRFLPSPSSSDQPVNLVGYGDFPVNLPERGQTPRTGFDRRQCPLASADRQSFTQGSRPCDLRNLAEINELVHPGRNSVAAPSSFSHQPSCGGLQDGGEDHLKYKQHVFPPSTESDGSSDDSVGGTLRRIYEIPSDAMRSLVDTGPVDDLTRGNRAYGILRLPCDESLVAGYCGK